jgi:hypothetical protein
VHDPIAGNGGAADVSLAILNSRFASAALVETANELNEILRNTE